MFALDVFTLCTAALVTFLTSLAASRGVLRFYLFLGEAAGWAAYACTVGRVTVFLRVGCCACSNGWFFALCAVCVPHLGRQPAGLPGLLWICGKKIAPHRKKALKPDGDVVYNRDSFPRQAKKSRMADRKGGEQRAGYRNKRKEKAARQSAAENRDRRILSLHGAALVNQQIQISAKTNQLNEIQRQLEEQDVKNEELERALSDEGSENGGYDDAYIERYAREELDFAKPGERVFVNVAGN